MFAEDLRCLPQVSGELLVEWLLFRPAFRLFGSWWQQREQQHAQRVGLWEYTWTTFFVVFGGVVGGLDTLEHADHVVDQQDTEDGHKQEPYEGASVGM